MNAELCCGEWDEHPRVCNEKFAVPAHDLILSRAAALHCYLALYISLAENVFVVRVGR